MDSVDSRPLAVVTGAAQRVGRMIALHLARQGYAIGLHYYTSNSEAQSTAEEITSLGVPVFLLQANLMDPEDIQTMFEELEGIAHPLKVLVNSAAIMPKSDLMKVDVEDWNTILNLNARSVWLATRKAASLMQTGGSIINISDVGAQKNWTGYGAYVISKAMVENLTRIMARQLAPQIRVNAIAPGLLMRDSKVSEADWQTLIDKVPMKKAGDENQFLDTLDFLLFNEYITGEIITIAGGYQLG